MIKLFSSNLLGPGVTWESAEIRSLKNKNRKFFYFFYNLVLAEYLKFTFLNLIETNSYSVLIENVSILFNGSSQKEISFDKSKVSVVKNQ